MRSTNSDPEPSELHAAILSLTAVVGKMQQSGGGRGDARSAPLGGVPCKNFAISKCRYGDLCRFSHSTHTTPDARMRAGKMLPQHERAIEDFQKKPYSERMAFIERPRSERVLTLKASLAEAQKEIAILKANAGGHLY
jgi:hypothetical protein